MAAQRDFDISNEQIEECKPRNISYRKVVPNFSSEDEADLIAPRLDLISYSLIFQVKIFISITAYMYIIHQGLNLRKYLGNLVSSRNINFRTPQQNMLAHNTEENFLNSENV